MVTKEITNVTHTFVNIIISYINKLKSFLQFLGHLYFQIIL